MLLLHCIRRELAAPLALTEMSVLLLKLTSRYASLLQGSVIAVLPTVPLHCPRSATVSLTAQSHTARIQLSKIQSKQAAAFL